MSSPATAPRALSETSFLRQTESVQQALTTFKGVIAVPNIVHAAIRPVLLDLIDATVCFLLFLSWYLLIKFLQDGLNRFLTFVHHPLFKTLPGEVQNALDEFRASFPKCDTPKNYSRVAGLVARVHDANNRPPPARRLPGSAVSRRQRTVVCFLSFSPFKRCLIDFSVFRRINVNVFLLRPSGIPTTRCRWPRTLLLIHLRLPPRIFLLFLTEPLNRLWLPLLPYVFLAYYSSFTQSLIFLDLCISSWR